MTRLPTTDLYFLNSCHRSVRGLFRRGPVERLDDNCYASGDTVLLVRNGQESLMRALIEEKNRRLVYLVDDDIAAAIGDETLPESYRQRLSRFHETYHAALTQRADVLVVTSEALQQSFSWHRDVRLLHPVWHKNPAGPGHFDSLDRNGPIHAVHLGTGSHAAGLRFLEPVIATLIQRFDRFHFTYIGQEPKLGALDRHPRIQRLRPRRWAFYRRMIGWRRFHLGLYPLPDTPFNRARSRSKLLEYGIVGAVGVYERDWLMAQVMAGGAAIMADPGEEGWIAALTPFLEEPDRLRGIAGRARPLLHRLNDREAQRRFWSALFEVTL